MTRAASDSLRGYSYQFHESIIRFLDAPNDKSLVTLEGIEDIDLENECIQVKYLASKKLLPSSVKKPASLMLEDYLYNRTQRQDTIYKIYAYFGDDTGDASFLNKDDFYNDCANSLISDTNKDISEISNDIQKEFKERLVLEVGQSFEDKEKNVRQKLEVALGASTKETDLYYYPNSMSFILNLSIQGNESDRTISKKDFFSSINKKNILFGIWQRLEKGERTFFSYMKRKLNNGDFRGNKERLVFIDTTFLKRDSTGYGISQLILDLLEQHSLIDKKTSTKPLTIVVGAPDDEIISIKSFLIDSGLVFNDGYEQINFSADIFNRLPIINTTGVTGRKIGKTSYEIRLIGLSTYLKQLSVLDRPRTAIYFSEGLPFDLADVVQYHIPAIDKYRNIDEILN